MWNWKSGRQIKQHFNFFPWQHCRSGSWLPDSISNLFPNCEALSWSTTSTSNWNLLCSFPSADNKAEKKKKNIYMYIYVSGFLNYRDVHIYIWVQRAPGKTHVAEHMMASVENNASLCFNITSRKWKVNRTPLHNTRHCSVSLLCCNECHGDSFIKSILTQMYAYHQTRVKVVINEKLNSMPESWVSLVDKRKPT